MADLSDLSEDDLERIAKIFARVLQQSRSVHDQEHYDHHVFIAKQMRAAEAREAFYRQMTMKLAERGVMALLTVIWGLLLSGLVTLFALRVIKGVG